MNMLLGDIEVIEMMTYRQRYLKHNPFFIFVTVPLLRQWVHMYLFACDQVGSGFLQLNFLAKSI